MKAHSGQGYGLLEVLTAMLLLAYGMLALVNGLLSAQHYAMDSLSLAQEELQNQNDYESTYLDKVSHE